MIVATPTLVLGVACRSPCLSLAGFSDVAKQDAACTSLTVMCCPPPSSSPLPHLFRITLASCTPVPPPAPCHLCLLSGSVLALSRLSLSPINKIAHLPRKLIACLNFSGGRQPTFSTANACRFSVACLLFSFFFAGRSRAKCARFRSGRRFENDFNRSALAYNAV